ncbi:MAG TPA: VWA domain-containing protein [Edaphobacter sp.]|jgi:VWFA-related protein|nr:VWA domain-containing protein [Edaphobacter sp.]
MIRSCRFLFALTLLVSVFPACAQQSSTPSTLSVDARLVNLPVIVRDKKGALVKDLTKVDFTLQVDKHPQTIRYFDIDTNLPLTLGLLVDTSRSQRSVLDDERTASSAFIDQMLTTPKDEAFVIQFARQVELLGDLTNSRPKLQAALKQIGTSAPASETSTDDDDNTNNSRHGSKRTYAGGTTLYDAAFLASDELMSKQKGRKALIILSDGVDRNSKETLNRALESAQRADTIIYAIYFKGEETQMQDMGRHRGGGFPGGGGGYPGGRYPGGGYPGGGGGYPGSRGGGTSSAEHVDGKKILRQMTDETGGRLFEVSKKQTVAQIFDQIAEELRAQYRLAFTPDQAAAAAGYHQIDLSTTRKNVYLQTRDGYYAGKE